MSKGTGTGNQVVGRVLKLSGTVKAISPDGTMRVLTLNSPVHANDRIVTESDSTASLQFDGPPVTHLDLGKATNILIDEEVYAGIVPEAVPEAVPEVVSEAAPGAKRGQQSLLRVNGYAGKILHVDLTNRKVWEEPLPEEKVMRTWVGCWGCYEAVLRYGAFRN